MLGVTPDVLKQNVSEEFFKYLASLRADPLIWQDPDLLYQHCFS
jgi:hypothetical protein